METQKETKLGSTWKLLDPHVRPRLGALVGLIILASIASFGQTFIVLLLKPLVNVVLFDGTEAGETVVEGAEPGSLTDLSEWFLELASSAHEAQWGPFEWTDDPRKLVLILVVFIAVLMAALSAAAQYASVLVERWLANRMVVDLRMQLARHLMGLSVRYHGSRSFGDLLSRISADVGMTLHSVNTALRGLVRDPIQGLFWLAVAVVVQPWIVLTMLVVLPIMVLPVAILAKKVRKDSTRSATELGASVQVMSQMFLGIRTVKAFRAEERELDGYRRINDSYMKSVMRVARAIATSEGWSILFSHAGLAVLLLALGWWQIEQGLFADAAQLLIFFMAIAQFYNSLKSSTRALNAVQESVGASQRLLDILGEEVDLVEATEPLPLKGLGSGIHIESVGFEYPGGDVPALHGLDLEIRPGETLAVVGPSGAGKSTLIDLVCRFIDPTEGRIKVDGVDLREVSLDDWTALYALVDQAPFLFHATIEENIRYGRGDATPEEVRDAARAAYIHDFIMELPEGYETNVADSGSRLSGGQRQRITIARALLKNAPLLLLDEATSALDSASEAAVQAALDSMRENHTVIVVAHRLSTVRNADRIAVLEAGGLVELGSHDDLMARGGIYAKLVSMQDLS